MNEILIKAKNHLIKTDNNNVNKKFIFLVTFIFIFALAGNSAVNAQTTEYPLDAVPPPLKIITKEERGKLSAAPKVKNRTKLSLELMDVRLANAEKLAEDKKYIEMFKELGRFHALIDNTLDFLEKKDSGKGKVLNNYKRLEIGLRKFLPKIELIRRGLPAKYEYYVRGLAKQVRDARSRAVEPMFDNSVLSNN